MAPHKQWLTAAWSAAIEAVNGRHLVKACLQKHPSHPTRILAIGKAASAMALGALDALPPKPNTLIITKYKHTPNELKNRATIKIIEAGHPIPDENSLQAGKAAIQFLQSAKSDEHLLLLISGGASALLEQLPPNISLTDLQTFNREMMASGQPIEKINQTRKNLSNLKGGQLLANFTGNSVTVYAISDVRSNDIADIGSGIGMTTHLSQDIKSQTKINSYTNGNTFCRARQK